MAEEGEEAQMPVTEKIEAIIQALDVNGDGELSPDEVKVLFSQIMAVPAEDIPDDHEVLILRLAFSSSTMLNPNYFDDRILPCL